MSYTYDMLKVEAEKQGLTLSATPEFAQKVESLFPSTINIHRCFSADGDYVLEFWKDEKNFTIYFYPEELWFLKSWGPDMNTEMEDGTFNLEDKIMIQEIIEWLQ